MEPMIPRKQDRTGLPRDCRVKSDKATYRNRSVVEQCVGWLKENRRIGTRFENAGNHLPSNASIGMIKRHLTLLFPGRTLKLTNYEPSTRRKID
jgi:hypothetical protein